MRILHITAQKPDSTGSGVYLSELVSAGTRAQCEQTVIAGIGLDDCPTFPPSVRFIPVRFETEELPFPVVGMSDEMPYRATRYRDMDHTMVDLFDAAFSRAVKEAVTIARPNIVLCHHLYLLTSLVRNLLPDIPVTAVCHSTDVRQMCQHGLERDRIVDAIRRLDAIFALHNAQKRDIEKVFGVDAARIHVVGTGFNSSVFNEVSTGEKNDENILSAMGVGERASIELVFAGKIWKKKGVVSLLHSLDFLPYNQDELVLYLAGGHANEDEYRSICAQAKASRYTVQFLGKLSQFDLAYVYRQADVFVLPSFFEGLPLVVVEALACGCSVVVTDLPGIRAWIDAQIPGAPIWYVEPPRIRNTDEPIAEDLPAFEHRLAEAIEQALAAGPSACCDLAHVSWDALFARMLAICETGGRLCFAKTS